MLLRPQISVVASLLAVIVVALTALSGCHAPGAKPDDATPTAAPATASTASPGAPLAMTPTAWTDKMQGLSVTLSGLLPLVASRSRFNDPANFEKIERGTLDLRGLSHDLKSTRAPNADPVMAIMSGMMSDDIDRALDSLRSGNRDFARQILKDTTSYCFQCHTQAPAGPNPGAVGRSLKLSIDTASLSPLDQAEFFAATRQFDRALASYRVALSNPALAKADAFAWEQAARSALAILVRVKGDPKESASLVAKLEKQTDLPQPMKDSVAAWKVSIHDWLGENPRATHPKGLLDRASHLIESAHKKEQFPLDHSQDISYFRASSLVHEFLRQPSVAAAHDSNGARALFLAGVVAEATRDLSFWTLHETYYEQCIRWLPHSKQAEECYDRLKDSVTLGYSGSSGVNVPREVSKRLESFRILADADPEKK